jgi:hypothetical protein
MIVSIHQPNFIPWIPFFEKIRESDVFVLLGNCQFEKNGFQNRFDINESWITMPVNKKTSSIRDKKYIDPEYNWNKIKKTLKNIKFLDDLDKFIGDNLFETNSEIIKYICKKLSIEVKLEEDFPTNKTGSERLLEICEHFGAKKYLSGPSGRKYLDEFIFKEKNIDVIYFDSSKSCKNNVLSIL